MLTNGIGKHVMAIVEVLTHPAKFVTVSVIVYVPPAEYVCVGFCWVDVVASPKFQLYVVDAVVPVEVFVNVTGNPAQAPLGVNVNEALGTG